MHGAHHTACMLGVVLGLLAAQTAVGSAEAYQTIAERNVFGLRPPDPAVPPPPPPPPPNKITLTGITTILGSKRALMSVAIPNKPPETLMLTEGQRQGEIEVVQIDEKAGVVKVKNQGVDQTLDFLTDGAKALPATAAVTPGVIPPPPGAQPGAIPQAGQPHPNQPNPNFPQRTLPQRTIRIPQAPGANSTQIPPPPVR